MTVPAAPASVQERSGGTGRARRAMEDKRLQTVLNVVSVVLVLALAASFAAVIRAALSAG